MVDDIDREYARIPSSGVSVTTAIETEPWGERFFQVNDAMGGVEAGSTEGAKGYGLATLLAGQCGIISGR